LTVGPVTVDLQEGVWSAIIQIPFKLGRWLTLPALTRVILSQTSPVLKLYFLPLQQHPLRSPFPYGTPRSFLKETWKTCGPFLTLGWPHEATGLEEGCITDGQFLDLCDLIFEERRRILLHQLESFEEGLIGAVLDTLDRVQHMFWRDRPDVVENWYLKLDALLGEIQSRLDQSTRTGRKANLLVVSSHGFSSFDYKVHLNRWLLEGGYLVPSADLEAGDLSQVNWNWTRSYAVGLNSLYLNLAGRERDGVVLPSEKDQLVRQLTQALLRWQGPDGRKVVSRVWDRQGAFQGTYSPSSPDLVIGFNPGYRASAETGLGRWEPVDIEPNRAHWGADHCFAPDRVPGVVFSSSGLAGIRNPSYKDIPMLAIGKMPEGSVKPPSAPRPRMRDEEDLEERLRSLEYL